MKRPTPVGNDGATMNIPAAGPSLGLATTAQLLDELRARGERLSPHGDAATGDEVGARFMAITTKHLLNTLPPVVLDYRTAGR